MIIEEAQSDSNGMIEWKEEKMGLERPVEVI